MTERPSCRGPYLPSRQSTAHGMVLQERGETGREQEAGTVRETVQPVLDDPHESLRRVFRRGGPGGHREEDQGGQQDPQDPARGDGQGQEREEGGKARGGLREEGRHRRREGRGHPALQQEHVRRQQR